MNEGQWTYYMFCNSQVDVDVFEGIRYIGLELSIKPNTTCTLPYCSHRYLKMER